MRYPYFSKYEGIIDYDDSPFTSIGSLESPRKRQCSPTTENTNNDDADFLDRDVAQRQHNFSTTSRKKKEPKSLPLHKIVILCIFFTTYITLVFKLDRQKPSLEEKDSFTRHSDSKLNSNTKANLDLSHDINNEKQSHILTISPGELPTYSGWARPAFTMAAYFDEPQVKPIVDCEIENKCIIQITCSHRKCCHRTNTIDETGHRNNYGNPRAFFFSRAYGPAVLTGLVEQKGFKNIHYKGSHSSSCSMQWKVEYLFTDPGMYILEVVLDFFNPNSFHDFPLPVNDSEPAYEGYQLPGFPIQVSVSDAIDSKQSKNVDTRLEPWCQEFNLVTNSSLVYNNDPFQGRWVVKNKINTRPFRQEGNSHIDDDGKSIGPTFQGYQSGRNSIGIQMEYRPRECRLMPDEILHETSQKEYNLMKDVNNEHVWDQCARYVLSHHGIYHSHSSGPSLTNHNHTVHRNITNNETQSHNTDQYLKKKELQSSAHIIFIGDSVMGRQHRYVKDYFTRKHSQLFENKENGFLKHESLSIKTTLLPTHGGIVVRFDEIVQELQKFLLTEQNETRYILFNTGLHDIAQLCSKTYIASRKEYLHKLQGNQTELNHDGQEHFSCVEVYRNKFRELVTFLSSYPAERVCFRTTTSGWPKYGNFGFAWPTTRYQTFPFSSDFVAYFNKVALEVLMEVEKEEESPSDFNISIMDGYWISLARPDHTEISDLNAIGPHLVHPGVEVISAMTRTFLMIIMRDLCSNDAMFNFSR